MNEFDGAIAAVRAVARRLRDELGDDPAAELVAGAAQYLYAPPLRVVAWGGAKRGKSELLSALAGDPKAFAHGIDDATTTVSSLRWSATATAVERRVPMDGGEPGQRAVDPGGLRDRGPAASSRDRFTLEVARTAPLEALRPGLMLIDTPAVDGRFSARNLAAQRHLAHADVVLVLAGPDSPLTGPELASLQLVPGRARVLGVFAKADRVYSGRAFADAQRKLTAQLRGRDADADPVPLFPVSARIALGSGDADDDSKVADLRRRLVLLATAQQAATAAGAERILHDALDGLSEPPARLLEALYRAESDDRALQVGLDRITADIAALRKRATVLGNDLREQTAKTFADIHSYVADKCEAIRDRAAQTRESPLEPEVYEQEFVNELTRIADEADARRADFVAGVIDTVQALTQAELTPPEAGEPRYHFTRPRPTPDRRPGVTFAAIRKGMEISLATAATGGAVGGTLGSAFGAVGAPVGAVVGAVLGQVFGLIGGTRAEIRRAQEDFRSKGVHYLADLAPARIAEAAKDMRRALLAMEPATLAALTGSLEAAVGQRLGQLEAVADGLAQHRSANPAERAAQIAQLEAQLAGYARLRDELTHGLAELGRIAVDHGREAMAQ